MKKWIKFDITPRPAPRETQGQRSPAYKAYKDELWMAARNAGHFELGKCFEIIFLIPIPKSWAAEKKARKHLTPHDRIRHCDVDNLLKAVMDALSLKFVPGAIQLKPPDDSLVWKAEATKLWVNGRGCILIRNQDEKAVLAEVRRELREKGIDDESS